MLSLTIAILGITGKQAGIRTPLPSRFQIDALDASFAYLLSPAALEERLEPSQGFVLGYETAT